MPSEGTEVGPEGSFWVGKEGQGSGLSCGLSHRLGRAYPPRDKGAVGDPCNVPRLYVIEADLAQCGPWVATGKHRLQVKLPC